MLKTILIGTGVSIQGVLERRLDNGHAVVRIGAKRFTGRLVERWRKPEA
ncbi:hypothetical protein [Histidinibacterium aquaticum]|nr:hypothetical protein [Histidinibacterium aquaticum]